jgi:hypothetical protein
LSGNSGAQGDKGPTALIHSIYLRREETRAMPQQLFTMKKENIQADGAYYICSYKKETEGGRGKKTQAVW